MLATTIQITNNPPHTTHTNNNRCWLAAQATTTTRAADAHTVLNVNPTVCLSAENFYAQPTKHAPTPTTHCRAVNTCRHKKTTRHNPNSHAELFPTKMGSLERR